MSLTSTSFSARRVLALSSVLFALFAAACGPSVDESAGGGGNGAGGGAADGGHLFACGDAMCDSATEYCEHLAYQAEPVCADMDRHECRPLPASCGAEPSCACLPAGDCYDEPGCTESSGELRHCDQQVC